MNHQDSEKIEQMVAFFEQLAAEHEGEGHPIQIQVGCMRCGVEITAAPSELASLKEGLLAHPDVCPARPSDL